mgnify:CR=1 FL=1
MLSQRLQILAPLHCLPAAHCLLDALLALPAQPPARSGPIVGERADESLLVEEDRLGLPQLLSRLLSPGRAPDVRVRARVMVRVRVRVWVRVSPPNVWSGGQFGKSTWR